MRGKCERGRGNINADGAGAEVFAGDGCSQGRLSAPWPRFDGVDRADVYIIIHVRACCCGECALNPPPSPPIPRRSPSARPRTATRPSRALSHSLPAQTHARRLRHAFLADLITHSPSKASARPRTATRPARALPLLHAAPTHARRLRDTCPPTSPPIPAEGRHPSPHSDAPSPSTSAPPPSADAHPPTSQHIPRRRSAPAPAQRHALPEHFLTPFSSTSAPPRSADARPQAARCIPRRKPVPVPAAPPCLPFCSASGTKKRHRTVDVRCRMSRSTVIAVGHWDW